MQHADQYRLFGSAVLAYDHGVIESDAENSLVEKTGKGFRFVSDSGGANYEIQVKGTKPALLLYRHGNNDL